LHLAGTGPPLAALPFVRPSLENRYRQPGFTLIELMVVVSIIAILASLSISYWVRTRSRGNLSNTIMEVQSAIHGAHQTALATGHDVVVMIFPDFTSGGTVGRFVIYEDGDFSLFDPASTFPHYLTYDPSALSHGPRSQVDFIDLPRAITIGPAAGLGSVKLKAPFQNVAVNSRCSFCLGPDNRGAIRFDSQGSVTFYGNAITPITVRDAAAFSLTGQTPSDLRSGQVMLVVSSASGSIQVGDSR
jgi:prepilin-type N-terminal cleavage/methylation domain-containing protein